MALLDQTSVQDKKVLISMKTSEILDITIITFNRAEYLQKTLNAVLAED
jgi:hypothetical protein